MTRAAVLTWESDRSPDEVIELLRSASSGTRTSIGGSGVRALILPGRRVVLWRSGSWSPLGRARFMGRVLAAGPGSHIVGTVRTPVALAIGRLIVGSGVEPAIGRDLEVICGARLVEAPPDGHLPPPADAP